MSTRPPDGNVELHAAELFVSMTRAAAVIVVGACTVFVSRVVEVWMHRWPHVATHMRVPPFFAAGTIVACKQGANRVQLTPLTCL